MSIYLSYIAALVITILSIHVLAPLAARIGLVDSPSNRKLHKGHIPLVGGIAMFFGFGFGLVVSAIPLFSYRSLFAGSALLIFSGVLDDFHELSQHVRLAVQIFATLLITVWGGAVLNSVGNLFSYGDIRLVGWALPFTVFAIIGFINAMNMLDGADGLAGGVALAIASMMLWLSENAGLASDAKMLLLMFCILIGFLSFNSPIRSKRRTRVFMGDAGSTFLGFTLAWFAITLSQEPHHAATPVTFLWILAVPIFDICAVTLLRLARGKSPLHADREHIHHLLYRLGLTPTQSTLSIITAAFILGALGVIGNMLKVPEWIMFLAFITLLMSYIIWVSHFRETKRLQL